MASIDYLSERRMNTRHTVQDDTRITHFHSALSLFLVMLAIMLMLSVAYFYATYVGVGDAELLMPKL